LDRAFYWLNGADLPQIPGGLDTQPMGSPISGALRSP